MLVTVFRHVPPPIIGTVGVIQDRAFEAFEERLDWLEAIGLPVERFDPRVAPAEVAAHESVRDLLSSEGDRCLPLILVNEVVVSHGVYPSRTQLARAVGRGGDHLPVAVARQLAAIGAAAAIGLEDEVSRRVAQAREMGIAEESIRLAGDAGVAVRHARETVHA